MSREERLSELDKVPTLAGMDHRYFLDDEGRDIRTRKLSRHERRRIKAKSRQIGEHYIRILKQLFSGGARFPIDKFLRSLAIEYTHRYASSGTMTQPVSFNYFEPFCEVKLIDESTAPYASPRPEYNHLFSVSDYFEYITSGGKTSFNIADLQKLPEGMIYHFTQNGSLLDFTYLNSQGKEFLISGFSMIRHGASLHWYMVGGEVSSQEELSQMEEAKIEIDLANTPVFKKKFLEEAMNDRGGNPGQPVLLEGCGNAVRTIIAGEFDILTSKHLVRCYMRETENSYIILSDDPDIFDCMEDTVKRDEALVNMKEGLERASVMWDLAEAFFQLPHYFEFRLTIPNSVLETSGLSKPRPTKGGHGIASNYKHVASLEISDVEPSLLVSYAPPPFKVETNGYWRRLDRDAFGTDRNGKPSKGRDWIKADVAWRAMPTEERTVFIKSTVGSAKLAIADYIRAAEEIAKQDNPTNGQSGVLYVMRCMAMQDEIYKVGWTSKTAAERAKELSTTGVPVPFEVVEEWKHDDPSRLETGVHAILDPYRIAGNREFFRLDYSTLRSLIKQEIARTNAD